MDLSPLDLTVRTRVVWNLFPKKRSRKRRKGNFWLQNRRTWSARHWAVRKPSWILQDQHSLANKLTLTALLLHSATAAPATAAKKRFARAMFATLFSTAANGLLHGFTKSAFSHWLKGSAVPHRWRVDCKSFCQKYQKAALLQAPAKILPVQETCLWLLLSTPWHKLQICEPRFICAFWSDGWWLIAPFAGETVQTVATWKAQCPKLWFVRSTSASGISAFCGRDEKLSIAALGRTGIL